MHTVPQLNSSSNLRLVHSNGACPGVAWHGRVQFTSDGKMRQFIREVRFHLDQCVVGWPAHQYPLLSECVFRRSSRGSVDSAAKNFIESCKRSMFRLPHRHPQPNVPSVFSPSTSVVMTVERNRAFPVNKSSGPSDQERSVHTPHYITSGVCT